MPNSKADAVLASRDASITSIPADNVVQVTIPLIKLDTFVAQRKMKIDFIKIDVEGFEAEVLADASETIKIDRPIVQFEFGHHHLLRRQNMMDFDSLLEGYRLFRLASTSMREIEDPSHYLSNIYSNQNIVAIDRSRQADERRSVAAFRKPKHYKHEVS